VPLDLAAFLQDDLEGRLNADPRLREKLSKTRAIVQLELLEAADDDRLWYVQLDAGTCRVHRGTSDTLDATLRGNHLDFVDLFEGYADARAAVTDQRLEIEGDVGLAVRVIPLLFPPRR
jgi:predicted lipid carrier protein YhbT